MTDSLDFDSFATRFATEDDCINALFAAKWPDGFRCPHCGGTHAYVIRTRRLPLYECAACRHQTSLIAGTVLEGSRTPLTKWFQALYLVAHPEAGINAVRLADIIAVTYKTAWLMLHKIRFAMRTADDGNPLTGIVWLSPGVYGESPFRPFDRRLPGEHPVIVGAAVDEQGEIRQLKLKALPPDQLKPGSKTVHPLGWVAFRKAHIDASADRIERGFGALHRPFRPLQRAFRAAAKRINDTYHGVGAKHLQAYLDEYAGRLNEQLRGTSVFDRLIAWCAATPVLTYPALIGAKPASLASAGHLIAS